MSKKEKKIKRNGALIFFLQRDAMRRHPQRGRQMQVGYRLKSTTFDE